MPKECRSSGGTDRTGLYIMVIFVMLNTCSMREEVQDIQKQVEAMTKTEIIQ